mgnify:CR=1 FL=1
MIIVTLVALSLVAATVLVHVVGLLLLIRWMMARRETLPVNFWPVTWLFVRLVWALLLIHSAEVAIWAFFYRWQGGMPDLESAAYFSGVTYTTVGYGDLLLQPPWRILAPVEGLTGIVMSSLSAAFFFAVMTRVFIAGRERGKST